MANTDAGNGTQDPNSTEPKLSDEAAAKQAEAAAANKAREEAAKLDAQTAPYIVAPGGSISCLRGVVDAGQPVQALDFAHGKAALDDLVARGAVIKRSKPRPVATE
jgi:hypothetical protein